MNLLQCAAGIICSGILLALACCAAGELVFDVVAHGARGDGRTDDTKVRVRAIHLPGPSDRPMAGGAGSRRTCSS